MPVLTGWWAESFVVPAGITSGESFGTATLQSHIRPSGIASAESFGTLTVTYLQDISTEGIASAESFGVAAIGQVIAPEGAISAETFGDLTVSTGAVSVAPTGISSDEAFGTAQLDEVVALSSVPSAEAFGASQLNLNLTTPGVASAEAFGTQAVTRGSVSISTTGIPGAETFGTAVIAQPIAYATQGVGTETSSSPTTCSVSPSAGHDVLVFFSVGRGGGGVINATYGASNLPMTCVGQALSSGALISAFLIRGVASGSATVNVYKTGSNWGQAVAVTYAGAQGYTPGKSNSGSGTTFSQSVTVPAGGKVVHAFTPGENATTLSSLTGGTSRYLDNAGFLTQSVRDTAANDTFAGTLSTTRPWAALAVPLLAGPASGPLPGYCIGTSDEGFNGTKTFDVHAASGDYVYVAVTQAGAGDPSSVTCAGSAMTLMDTQTWNSTGFLKIYRSSSAMGSSGAKTVSVTGTGSNWWRAAGLAVSGVTSPSGTVTKTSGSSSQPTQAVTCSAGQSILQAFASNAEPTGNEGGTSLYLAPTVSSIALVLNVASESTTFKLANTSVNWGAVAVVLS